MKKYIVIYTDFGDSCDGFARAIGSFDDMASAQKAVQSDINCYLEENKRFEDDISIHQPDRVLIGSDYDGCQWQILEVEV